MVASTIVDFDMILDNSRKLSLTCVIHTEEPLFNFTENTPWGLKGHPCIIDDLRKEAASLIFHFFSKLKNDFINIKLSQGTNPLQAYGECVHLYYLASFCGLLKQYLELVTGSSTPSFLATVTP